MDMANMNVGAMLFNKELPFVCELDGEINGHKFSVRGKGIGNSAQGLTHGIHVCTSGELPVSWTAITHNLQYGLLCFSKSPHDINDYIKSTFPEGYTKERTSNFEGDGKYTSRHVITYENGCIYNRVTINGSGFSDDGNVLGKNLADYEKPVCSMYFPGKDGLRAEVCKLTETKDGGYQCCRLEDQVIRPISQGPTVQMTHHYNYSSVEYSKDANETRDHIVMKEITKVNHFIQ